MKKDLHIIYYISALTRFSILPMMLSGVALFYNFSEIELYGKMAIIALVILATTSLVISLTKEYKDTKLQRNDDAIIVTLTWLLTILLSSIPYMLFQNLTFTQSFFESTSGWTTTGLSVLNVANAPLVIILYRSLTQFFGGVGIVLVALSFIVKSPGLRLYTQEGHNDQLMPNLNQSARLIFKIYIGYVAFGILGYVFLGMNSFDAINIAMAALSTGGFAPQAKSIIHYNSFPIELFTMILMVLGATNFATHLLLLNRRFIAFLKTSEFKIFACASLLISSIIYFNSTSSIGISLRIIVFEVISAITTTGFTVTSGYSQWRPIWVVLLVILMVIGGGSGSTAGGIKQSRIAIASKSIFMYFKRLTLPKQIIKNSVYHHNNGEVTTIDKNLSFDSLIYIVIYLTALGIGTLIFALHDYSVVDSLFEFASSLGTVGTSTGIISMTTPNVLMWTSILGMLFGRLEIMVIVAGTVSIIKRFQELR
ncbi:MAG: TrkH family potassium uptake protein [Erysipelothrix sp.]|jgi:trk system potassium uptake protein TrkH|nr:TrkH family potassium uptake protein [Erysipelothrix sp.]